MTESTHHPDVDFNLRVLERVAGVMPTKFHELISSFAETGDIDILEAVLGSEIAGPEYMLRRPPLVAAIFPVRKSTTDKVRADRLVTNWLRWLGIESDPRSLSTYLGSGKVTWPTFAKALIDFGADPNYPLEESGTYRTPVGRAFDTATYGEYGALEAMIDHLNEQDRIPLHSVEVDIQSGERKSETTLFSALLENMKPMVVLHLCSTELSGSWRVAIGQELSRRERQFGIESMATDVDSLLKLISVAEFEDPDHWLGLRDRLSEMPPSYLDRSMPKTPVDA